MIDLSEYRLETIRKDDEFILYSGTRQTDATASSIFVLTPASEHPAVASLRSIEHEYSLQGELDPYRPGEARRANDARARELRGRPSVPIHRETPGIEAILTAGDRLVSCARPAARTWSRSQGHQAKPCHYKFRDWAGVVNRFRPRFAPSTRAPGTRTSRVSRRDTTLHGARTDRTNESFDRFAE